MRRPTFQSLFQPKFIEKRIKSMAGRTDADDKSAVFWQEQLAAGALKKEVANYPTFQRHILEAILGYTSGDTEHAPTYKFEEHVGSGGRVEFLLAQFEGDTDLAGEIPLEIKGSRTRLDVPDSNTQKSPVQQVWNYGTSVAGTKWLMVCNYAELRLYHYASGHNKYERFDLARLNEPFELARFQLILGAKNLLSGKTEALLNESEQADKEITGALYTDYKSIREALFVDLVNRNPNRTPASLVGASQKLLDRILFIAFAEDKGLLPSNTLRNVYGEGNSWVAIDKYQNFKALFNAIDVGNKSKDIPAYNGGLFAPDKQIDDLVVSDNIFERFAAFGDYDFDSDVSISVLGHIFEQSISDLEKLTTDALEDKLPAPQVRKGTKSRSVQGKRKRHGVVYTPDAITQYIVDQTLGAHIEACKAELLPSFGKLSKDGATIRWNKAKRKKAYPTAELAFWKSWRDKLSTIKIVDPACGSGAFLLCAVDLMMSKYTEANQKIAELQGGQTDLFDLNKHLLNGNLYGADINRESIEITKLSLWLKTAQKGEKLTTLDGNLKAFNSLGVKAPLPGDDLCWDTAFPEVMKAGGFDVVLGNPPYVRQERFSDLKPWLEENYAVYHGVTDLYAYFFELGHRLLKPSGRMGYISSSTFFKTGSGEPLRDYLRQRTSLEQVVDFGDLQVFEGVTTYPAIITLQKLPPSTDSLVRILSLTESLPKNLTAHFSRESSTMRQGQLGRGSWQLESEAMFALRMKLTKGQPMLKEVCGSPFRGILTGYNAAFVIDHDTCNRLIKEDPRSADLLKPYVEGKDLKKWHAQPRGLWLIVIPKGWTRLEMKSSTEEQPTEIDAWNWLVANYPAITAWLLPFAEKARKRGDKGEYWWELRTCAYYEAFEGLKIFYPDITDSPKFHLDTTGSYSGNTGYFLSTDSSVTLGIINSKVVWVFLTGISDAVRGGFYRMFSQNMNQIPVPKTTPAQQKSIGDLALQIQNLTKQRYVTEKRFRRRLPDLCPPDRDPKLNNKMKSWWELDFKDLQEVIKKQYKRAIPLAERTEWQDLFESEKERIFQINNEVRLRERQLNIEVYTLFDLNAAEIALIEANT